MDVSHLDFLARQPSAALSKREHFWGIPKRGLAIILANALFWQPLLAQADGIVVSGSGTSVGQSANGVPVINIAAPNGSGLSHNQFHDYNVGSQGIILNNSTQDLQNTQLGGHIFGNSGLNGRAATVILNEVNGGNPSQLRGYTEVAGQSAHVIVANPYGISCNGCGFINTPQATLTTGKPVIENGQLTRYQVDQGSISIDGGGLNANNIDRFEIITRSAKINAEIQARNLTIVAGANDVDARSLNATARAANPVDAPQLAIDSSALGGMYAGAIRLVGTEAGVGVKLHGDMVASGGDIQLDANGQLTLARASATNDLDIKSRGVVLTDTTYAGRDVRVVATDSLEVGHSLTAAGNLHVEGRQISNQGNLNAGFRDDATVNSGSHLQIQGGKLTNSGKIVAQGTLGADLQNLDNRGGIIGTQQGGRLDVSGTLDNRDSGLILGKDAGLTVDVGTLDNRKGTLQSSSGDLSITARDILDNHEGKVLTGAGAMTLVADTLRNTQGHLNALGGKLSATVGTLDNSLGDIRSDSVAITSTSRLTNDHGHIVATAGDLVLKRGEIVNDNGEMGSLQRIEIDADSLQNANGTLSAKAIDLTLTGQLDNDQGLLESAETLGVEAGDISNVGGKMRALGSDGSSRFQVGGRFVNDNGLVEIGNDRFVLNSAGLSNQQGIVRHLGQGFELALSDVGNAGGSFITNGALELDLADWTNTSLIQAQKIGIKLGKFTQTASGKLISVDSIVATGDSWQNDGSLETEGDLNLTLTGHYQGRGTLKSLGKISLAALGAQFSKGAEVRSGGNGEFVIGSDMLNAGILSAGGDLLLKVDSLTNQGTLGSAKILTIEASDLLNDGGLLFSGADTVLRAGRFINSKGDLFSLGKLDITGLDGAPASLIENISGTIESVGDMDLRAARLINRKDVFAFEPSLTSASISLGYSDYCDGKNCLAYYGLSETYGVKITQDSARAGLMAGGRLNYKGERVDNEFSTISSGGPMTLDTQLLKNIGAGGGEQRYTAYTIYTKDDAAYFTFVGNVSRFNAYNDPSSPSYNPSAMPFSAIALGYSTDHSVTQTSGSPIGGTTAIIQSAGTVNITGSQQIENGFIRPGEIYVGGDDRVDSTQVASSAHTLPQLNAQSAPDLSQKAVDPLSLPGFILPTGEKGLFWINSDPKHKYLIETNPVFANLNQFINSDYLLNHIGYNPDQTQRRLGDGLYEQRLIRDAVIARTGERFIAGLDSDEAMFRYLMDNAIASKSTLDLSPGISLTSAQVAALTHDIVWMEERVVNGEKVLVPVLYLAQANHRLASNGALIQGSEVTLISGGNLENAGTLRATANLSVIAGSIANTGLMEAGEKLDLLALQTIRNAQGGIVTGRDISATAVLGDLVNERSVTTTESSRPGYQSRDDVVNNAARFEAANSLSISAGQDVLNVGGVLQAGRDIAVSGARDVVIGSQVEEDSVAWQQRRNTGSRQYITQYGSEVTAGGDISIVGQRDVAVQGSKLKAGNDVEIAAGENLILSSAANEVHEESRGKKGKKKTTTQLDQVTQIATEIEAGGSVMAKAGNDLNMVSSRILAGNEAYLSAGSQLNMLAAQDKYYSLYDMKKKGGWGNLKTRRDEVTHTTNVGSEIKTGGNLTLKSGDDQHYQVASLESGKDLTLESGGSITFEGVKDLDQESHEKTNNNAFWNLSKGKGTTDETLRQTQMLAAGTIVIKAVEGLKIDIKQVDRQSISQTIDAMAKSDPKLAWLKEAETRGDVDWRQVKEIHDSFKYNNSGLGPASQLIIAIVMAAVVGPAALSAAGGATAASVTAGTLSVTTAGGLSAAASAVAVGAATNATTSFINNGGNLGAVFKDVTSSGALKGYAISGVTAGLTSSFFNEWTGTKTDLTTSKVTVPSSLGTWTGVGQFASSQVLQAGTSTLLSKALGNGGDVSDALKGALFNTLAAVSFNAVGDYTIGKYMDGTPQKVAIHAIVGGLLAQATGSDFKTGALAAGANELLSAHLDVLVKGDKDLQSMASQIIGVLAAAAQTDTDASKMQSGSWVAKNATQYNRQLHSEEDKWLRENAKKFAASQGISEQVALERLSQQALKEVDYLWRALLSDGSDSAAMDFLAKNSQTFTNELGEQQALFTARGQQLFRPEMFADTADPQFYRQFVQSGISRNLDQGLLKELKDSGIDLKNGAVDLAKLVADHPGTAVQGLWEGIKGIPGGVVDGFYESGQSIGQGAAVAFSQEIADKLNAIYSVDVSTAQETLLLVRTVYAVAGAGAVGKAGGKVTAKVSEAVSKKLDDVLKEANERALLGKNGEGTVGSGHTVAPKSIDKIFETGRTPKASELKQYAEAQGWKPTQTNDGPLKYIDENGIRRVTIKQGSLRAPGSADPHVEFRNAADQRTDAFGNLVTRKSPGNHSSIDFDL